MAAAVSPGDADHTSHMSDLKEKVDQEVEKIFGIFKEKMQEISKSQNLIQEEIDQERDKMEREKDTILADIANERAKLEAKGATLAYFEAKLGKRADLDGDRIVRLSVLGEPVDTLWSTLTSCPDSNLESIVLEAERKDRGQESGKKADGRILINRNPVMFKQVLEYLRANVVPDLKADRDEAAYLREIESFYGMTKYMYPMRGVDHRAPEVLEKSPSRWKWRFRCQLDDIDKDKFFTSPDFKFYKGNTWRMLFTERSSFLSVYVHNLNAGSGRETGGTGWDTEALTAELNIELVNNNRSRSAVKKIEHVFTRKNPDIGLNYFMLIKNLRSSQSGFLVMSEAVSMDEEARPEIILELAIEIKKDGYMGQRDPVDVRSKNARKDPMLPGGPSMRKDARFSGLGASPSTTRRQ